MTGVSRVLGLVRDIVIARAFGAGLGADAFFVAFKIPNFLRRLFAEGAFSQAFVPVLSEYKTRREHAEVRRLVDNVVGVLGGILFLVTLAGVLAAPLLVMVFAPGFLQEAAKFDLTVEMIRVTFPYILFISLTALAGGILNSYGRFAVPAFTPALLNLCLIAAALWLAPRLAEPVTALAWGVFLAGVVQLLFQLPYLRGLGLLPRPHFSLRDEGVRRVARLMLPGIFGSSVAQINLLFDTLIASFLVTGSVSWLYFSDRLVEFPLGVFGIALATVILPTLSRRHADDAPEAFFATLDWALRLVMVMGVPAALALLVLAGPMLMTLFQYGAFDLNDVAMARLSLMAYAVGLLGFILVKVLAPGFYARQDTRTPVRVGVIAMLANMAMNVAFVVPMVVWELPGPHAGLALATSLSAFLNAGLLLHLLRRDAGYRPAPGWTRLLIQILVASAAMAALLWFAAGDAEQWAARSWYERAGFLALLVLA
ncbi:MAG: murein biosynthesis integral membrane protein MurJ, partial [Gammaproteobacteria bacterium]